MPDFDLDNALAIPEPPEFPDAAITRRYLPPGYRAVETRVVPEERGGWNAQVSLQIYGGAPFWTHVGWCDPRTREWYHDD